MARVQAKSERVGKLFPEWIAAGGRHEDIAPLGEQLDALMKAGRLAEADATLDRMLAILTTPPHAADTVGPEPLPCPTAALTLTTGRHVLRTDCTIKGDVTIVGTATLTADHVHLVIDGNLALSGDGGLKVSGGTLTIANRWVMQHSIAARDRARLEMIDATLETNAGEMDTNLASSYRGSGDSLLRFVGTRLHGKKNWLLADFFDRARLESVDSDTVPTEVSPHDAATVTIRGRDTQAMLWLEFRPGFRGLLQNLPSHDRPYSFTFGRNTPALTNVGYQVEVLDARARIGVNSHPRSDLTIRDNVGPVTIGFWLDGSDEPEVVSGLEADAAHPITRTVTHQGRTLRLERVTLNPYAWQLYVGPPRPKSATPMQIERSTINELGVFADTPVVVRDTHVQWAIIGATSARGDVTILSSSIDAQAVIVENDGIVRIEDSTIYGSILQARGRSTIALLNSKLEGNRSNPSIPGKALPTLKPADQARIVVLDLRPVSRPHHAGATTPLEGEAYVRTVDGTSAAPYALAYRAVGSTATTAIPTPNAPAHGILGSLPPTLGEPGSYEAILEVTIGGSTYRASRPFMVEPAGSLH
jgi:hypothetical protein